MFKPDQKQHDAIHALGKNIVVSASAGAGKTAVLIARLMKRILDDKVGINEICALTFTDAAANEMKVRLLKAMNEKLNTPLEENDIQFLTQQVLLVETANISTIHSFCLDIIKNYGYILDIDPARTQNILDPAIVKIYKENAMDKTLNYWIENYPKESRLLLDTFVSNPIKLSPLKTSITTVAEYLASKPYPKQEIENILSNYSATSWNQLSLEVITEINAYYYTQFTMINDGFEDVLNIAFDVLVGEAHKDTVNQIKESKAALEQALMQAKNNDISYYNNIPNIFSFKLPNVRKHDDELLLEDYRVAGSHLGDLIKKSLEYYMPKEFVFNTLKEQKLIVENLIEVASWYLHAFEEEKKRVNGFDFDDFEHYALRILKHDNGAIAHVLQERYEEIMVDEFQDTNEFQDAIIQTISKGNNIFRVGDIKQSIYRFRGAKPKIMQNLMKDSTIETIHFKANYRSKVDIVEYNNTLFSKLMSFTPNQQYQLDDFVEAGNPRAHEERNLVELELVIIEKEDVEKYSQKLRNEIHAQSIANKIIRLHLEENISFKDITILTRRHSDKVFLKDALEAANIPHYIDDRSGFYQSRVINQIISWLNYILYPDDYYLVDVLNSVFFELSLDTISLLKINHGSLEKGLEMEFPKRFAFLQESKKRWQHLSITEVLGELFNTNGAYHEKLPLQVKTNLDALLEKAIHFEKTNNPTIQGFLHFVKNLDDTGNTESTPIDESQDVVRVATIHQSKGLQYLVTILWSLPRRNVSDFKQSVLVDEYLGIAINDIMGPYRESRKSILRMAIESKQNTEDLEEYIRLLYVALTRAENRLIITDVLNEEPEIKNLSLADFYQSKPIIHLIYSIKSKHLKKEIIYYPDFKVSALDTPLLAVPQQSFEKEFVSKETIQVESYDDTFEFNESFMYAIEYGNRLHHALESLPTRIWQSADLKHVDQDLHQKLMKYNQNPFTQKLYTFKNIEQEMPFIFEEDSKAHQGIIDFLCINDDEIIVVDFKSDSTDELTLINRYKNQLNTYKKALMHMASGLPITTYIYSFNLNKYIKIDE